MKQESLPTTHYSKPNGSGLDPRKTLMRAVGVLCMLVIAVFGMCYAAWFLWTGAK